MTTLQDSSALDHAQNRSSRPANEGDAVLSRQQQQQGSDEAENQNRNQSGDDSETFTVSLDDWFKS
jgi:hypothetical protein